MEEVKSEKKTRSNKKLTFTITMGLVTKIILGLIVVAILLGVYKLGVNNGKDQKANQSPASRLQSAANSASKRWSQIGTVTEVTDSKIKIKDSKGEEEALVNGETVVTGSDGKKADIKAVKKDQRVVATGTKDDKGVQTATRIRIQK